jgi:hypothetical protein
VDGTPARIVVPVIGLKPKPDAATGIDTELLFGEEVTVFDRADGWCWVKAVWTAMSAICRKRRSAAHRQNRPTSSPCSAPSSIREPELRKPYKSDPLDG